MYYRACFFYFTVSSMDGEAIMEKLFGEKFPRVKYVQPSPTSYRLRRRVKELYKTVQKFKARKMTRKESKKAALDYIHAALNPVQSAFLCSVIENASRKARGRRYSLEAKAIAMSLFLFDPRAYKNLRELLKALPSQSLLRSMLDKNPVEEGFQPFVFEALKFATSMFDERSRFVSLSWDGINLNPALNYVEQNNKDGKGSIDGFIGGLDHSTKEPASEAVVLMVRSIFGDFKQPLAYFNFDPHLSASKLEPIINRAIEELQNCGLIVKTLVCDQASEHQSLFGKIFKVSPEKPYIVRNDCKIFCMFDPPHLLKSVKANLKLHIAQVGENKELVSWKHIIDFYEADSSNLTRIAPKLFDNHIYGTSITNMNVPMAAQVMSRTVAGGIREYVKQGVLHPSALATAELLELFNDVFDSTNSRMKNAYEGTLTSKEFPENVRDFVPPPPPPSEPPDEESQPSESMPTTRNPLLSPLSDTSLHLALWEKAEKYIKTIRFFNDKTGIFSRPPCLNGWLLTISSLRGLWEEMKTFGFKQMPTKYLNQDFIENFFSQVRYRNGHSDVTPQEFRIIFKFLLHQHIMDPSRGKNTNCAVDGGKFLFLMQNSVHKKLIPASKDVSGENEEDIAADDVPDLSADVPVLEVPGVEEPDQVVVPETTEQEYKPEAHPGDVKFSSYLARRIVLHAMECSACQALYTSKEMQPQHSILENIANKDSCYKFVASSAKMQLFVHNAVIAFDSTLKKSFGERNLGHLIAEAIKNCSGFDLLKGCPAHRATVPLFFLKTFVRAMMRYRMKLQKAGLSAYIIAARERKKKASLAASGAKQQKLFSLVGADGNLEAPGTSNRYEAFFLHCNNCFASTHRVAFIIFFTF